MTATAIADLVPHAGPMCLLDEVVDWQADRIHCRAAPRAGDSHPLYRDNKLPATALIEYAAQATAAHGTLLARSAAHAAAPAAGRLVALRQVELTATADANAMPARLDVYAERVMADAAGSIYTFRVVAGETVLVRGRLTIHRSSGDAATGMGAIDADRAPPTPH
ncbi:hypothetical protein [Salinisphaera sp.]|uniref:hypothetical protein n=1 Tax=Salinisphaera sp. TaxID=1914330 RepID=UPI002D78CC0D|nr:hypothetical protein [Salinisphaera sp.]HET7315702.1 hypothetical protein [Salinisphaera sp.]